MFDEVSGEDGSGVVHEQEQSCFGEEIPTSFNRGDIVELQIASVRFWAEVTTSNGRHIEISALEKLNASNGAMMDIGDVLQFNLSNIVRCKHAEQLNLEVHLLGQKRDLRCIMHLLACDH